MTTLTLPAELNWRWGKPQATGVFKQQPEDFLVTEQLGFSLTGEGEHLYLLIRKRELNTQFVADKLAQYLAIPPKLVSYAGLKDRQGVTEQWFSLHLPGKSDPDWQDFNLAGCEILQQQRHNKKLQIGALQGNHFQIVLRDIENRPALLSQLEKIKAEGVLNYFGPQRFGRDNYNWTQGVRWAQGMVAIKDRQKRSFCLSALRSGIFNLYVSQRVSQNLSQQVLSGDILQFSDGRSWFQVKPTEIAECQSRVQDQQLVITAPLVGENSSRHEIEPNQFEQQFLEDYAAIIQFLHKQRVAAQRRALFIYPQHWQLKELNATTLQLAFFLPAGCYATSVLRELLVYREE